MPELYLKGAAMPIPPVFPPESEDSVALARAQQISDRAQVALQLASTDGKLSLRLIADVCGYEATAHWLCQLAAETGIYLEFSYTRRP